MEDKTRWCTYLNGFSSKRKVIFVDGISGDVILNIYSDKSSAPLFQGKFIRDSEVCVQYTCNNPTTVYKNLLAYLNFVIKGKLNGNRFFGLQTKEFKDSIKNLFSQLTPVSASAPVTLVEEKEIVTPAHLRKSSWAGVINYSHLSHLVMRL